MSEEKYSDEEIVKAFKSFVERVVEKAAIDYARKIKSQKYREVLFSDCVDEKVSLSVYDSGTFFDDTSVDIIDQLKRMMSVLKPKDRTILELIIKNKTNQEIADFLNINEKTVRNRKSLLRKTLKERLKSNENINK